MRVLYPAPMLQNLQTAIRNKELGESDRAALILDAFSLAKNGNMDMAEVCAPAYQISIWSTSASRQSHITNVPFFSVCLED